MLSVTTPAKLALSVGKRTGTLHSSTGRGWGKAPFVIHGLVRTARRGWLMLLPQKQNCGN